MVRSPVTAKPSSLFLDVSGLEGHGGEFLRVEEVGALEVAVALLVLRVDGADIDGDFEGGLGVVGIDATAVRR